MAQATAASRSSLASIRRKVSVTLGPTTIVPVPGRQSLALPVDIARRRPSTESLASTPLRRARTASQKSFEASPAAHSHPRTASWASTPAAGGWGSIPMTPESRYFWGSADQVSFGALPYEAEFAVAPSSALAKGLAVPDFSAVMASAPYIAPSDITIDTISPISPPPGGSACSADRGMFWGNSSGFTNGSMLQMPVQAPLPSPGPTIEAPCSLPLPSATARKTASGSTRSSQHSVTTVMLRNIPQRYNRESLVEDMHARGFASSYDFFYLPIDFNTAHNVGYAFINFVSESEVHRFRGVFEGLKLFPDSPKVCAVCDAKLQGRDRNVEFYRNSTVMGMDNQYHPLMLVQGRRRAFPAPTRPLVPIQRRPASSKVGRPKK